jgi:hypothetical protein
MAETNQATTAKRQRPLKVWGGRIMVHNPAAGRSYCRAVVAATSQAKAAQALFCSLRELRNYWAVTGNKKEIALALSQPGCVFAQTSETDDDYLPKVWSNGRWVDA